MDPITRRSTTSFLFILAGGIVNISLKRQYLVNLSSTEVEYVTYCQTTKKAVWLWLWLKELGYSELGLTTFFCDNNSVILLANNPEIHARTKHIDTQVHWIRKIIKSGQVILKWILGTEQIANRYTKPLDCLLYQSFVTRARIK